MSKLDPPENRIDTTTLDGSPGHAPSKAPPVEILLLSEDAQQRAERVFVWSIASVRDPARVYRIHFLRSPREARVFDAPVALQRMIVNEVGQIYFTDPAQLFDLDLDDAQVCKVSSDVASPLLLDVAGLSAGPSDAAMTQHPAQMIARARAGDVAWKPLDDAWRPRQETDADPRSGHLFHFKALHSLPWQPHPDRCIYHHNPQQALFAKLEEGADAAGFELFGPDAPSRAYQAMRVEASVGGRASFSQHRQSLQPADWEETRELVDRCGAQSGIDCSASHRAPALEGVEVSRLTPFDLVALRDAQESVDIVICDDWLDGLPVHDLGWVLEALFSVTRRCLRLGVACTQRGPQRAELWRERVASVSRRHPSVHWCLRVAELDTRAATAWRRTVHGGAWLGDAPPRVWVLADDRPGNATQSIGLASALAWPTEIKQLRYRHIAVLHNRFLRDSNIGVDSRHATPLDPPWPDLVIACGRRTAPVARWIRRQSGSRTRVVALGRKAGDDAVLFDLSVTPRYTRCMPHPRRMEIRAPLHRMTSEILRESAKDWEDALAGPDASPRIAVLVGGTSGQYWFGARSARKLGEQVSLLANSVGAALWVSTSRRTGRSATAALQAALGRVEHFHPWSPEGAENPYRGYLACADAFVITADSESMLAEACSTGKPVYVYPMDWRKSFRLLGFFRDLVVRGSRMNDVHAEGEKEQGPLAYFCSWLLARGFVRPTRDLDLLHESLIECGAVRKFGTPLDAEVQPPLFELDDVAERVRELMGYDGR